MNPFRTAGAMWLVAAVVSAVATLVFRDDSAWFTVTLVASAVATLVGVLLLWRADTTTVLMSTVVGATWIVIYVVLTALQSDDIQAWTADVFFALLGGAAAFIAYRAGRQAAA